MASTCSTLLALTWGGVQFQWDSVQVLIPLIIGLAGLAASLFYEFNWPANPTVRFFPVYFQNLMFMAF
jgi:hypothetical protein